MNDHKDINLDIDLLFVNKIKIILMISRNFRFIYFKALLSKHNEYIQNRLQQIIQSRRFKDVYTTVEGAFKIIVDWVNSSLHIDLINSSSLTANDACPKWSIRGNKNKDS